MGRKKKSFIDKKSAQTYRLVPRSQQDPLAENIDEAQYVLKALQGDDSTQSPSVTEEHRLEQQKYGIFYDDEYNYLQHLKEPGTAVLEPVGFPGNPKAVQLLNEPTAVEQAGQKATLPNDLFGSEIAVEGKLDKILPVSGPQPDWDPDIVAALEEAEMGEEESGGDLDDDFVLQANAGEPGVPVYVTELNDMQPSTNDPWWRNRVDFNIDGPKSDQSDSEEGDQSDIGSDIAEMGVDDGMERKSARFTHYSLSSSVVPRSEGLTNLDNQFEEFMVRYEDSELGALDEDDVGGEAGGGGEDIAEYDQFLLKSAVDDFEKNFKHQLQNIDELDAPQLAPSTEHSHGLTSSSQGQTSDNALRHSSVSSEGVESESGDSGEERVAMMEVAEKPREKWDCESILSTYSNLFNHPTKITETKSPQEQSKKDKIKLSSKTNLPLGALPGSLPKEKHTKHVPVTRLRNESKDDKKVRKQAVKEERKQRRADKKATKLAFKSESIRLERQLAGHVYTASVV